MQLWQFSRTKTTKQTTQLFIWIQHKIIMLKDRLMWFEINLLRNHINHVKCPDNETKTRLFDNVFIIDCSRTSKLMFSLANYRAGPFSQSLESQWKLTEVVCLRKHRDKARDLVPQGAVAVHPRPGPISYVKRPNMVSSMNTAIWLSPLIQFNGAFTQTGSGGLSGSP